MLSTLTIELGEQTERFKRRNDLDMQNQKNYSLFLCVFMFIFLFNIFLICIFMWMFFVKMYTYILYWFKNVFYN